MSVFLVTDIKILIVETIKQLEFFYSSVFVCF